MVTIAVSVDTTAQPSDTRRRCTEQKRAFDSSTAVDTQQHFQLLAADVVIFLVEEILFQE